MLNPFWEEELACWDPSKGAPRKMKKVSIRKELAQMWRWGFKPETKLAELSLDGWQKFKIKQKGGKSYGRAS